VNRFQGSFWGARLLRVAADLAVAVAAFYVAFQIRIHFPLPFTEALLPGDRIQFFLGDWGAVLTAQVVSLYFFGFYDPPQPKARLDAARGLSAAVGLEGLLLAGYWFLTEATFPRSVLVLYLLLCYAGLLAGRWLLDALHRPAPRRIVIVGAGSLAREVAEAINTHHWHGLTVVGHVVPEEEGDAGPQDHDSALGPRLGPVESLPLLLAAHLVDDVVLAPSDNSWQTRLLDLLSGNRPNVLLLPGPFESMIGRMRYRWVRDIPLIEVMSASEWRLSQPVKRLLDLAVASVLSILTLPVLMICALLVRATSPGPVLYRQRRVGRGRKVFVLWKLRTMRVDAEHDEREVLARPDDPRLTPVGAVLRRYRLDELPQLWNVVNGSMSLVGPRPERPGFVERYLAQVPGYAERFTIQPGLTGLAQINGEYHSSAQNKLRYDLAYVANQSLWLDLSILFRTVKIVLTSRGV
jgi:exopolysaccharide biosynthesis polyprenyl glycosylphosphotransferase